MCTGVPDTIVNKSGNICLGLIYQNSLLLKIQDSMEYEKCGISICFIGDDHPCD